MKACRIFHQNVTMSMWKRRDSTTECWCSYSLQSIVTRTIESTRAILSGLLAYPHDVYSIIFIVIFLASDYGTHNVNVYYLGPCTQCSSATWDSLSITKVEVLIILVRVQCKSTGKLHMEIAVMPHDSHHCWHKLFKLPPQRILTLSVLKTLYTFVPLTLHAHQAASLHRPHGGG